MQAARQQGRKEGQLRQRQQGSTGQAQAQAARQDCWEERCRHRKGPGRGGWRAGAGASKHVLCTAARQMPGGGRWRQALQLAAWRLTCVNAISQQHGVEPAEKVVSNLQGGGCRRGGSSR